MNVNRWTRAVNKDGVEALVPKKQTGRPVRMTPKIVAQLELHLEESPQKFGLNRVRWDGPTLATHLQRQFGIKLKVRQAQYWMHQLGYRLKRASHAYLRAKAEDAKTIRQDPKKNSKRWVLKKPLFFRTNAVLPSILDLVAAGRLSESD